MSLPGQRARVTAVLGPTNTGKTHFAIERLLAHSSGAIGFPLRLLARENYDRVVRLKGARQVALVTGEEKIVPAQARYFLCTAESMPLERPFDFIAVDEVQMCADPERGHVFTDRLLGARGLVETMLLGADTMRPLIRRLVPEADFVGRPRLSRLTYAGAKKLTRLPPRTAVVAFSAARVYEIAELLRRQRGGAAIVLGALSPRTRNAQVEMYQAGEVDYLVATDAIGMGLNMRLDHVAFYEREKFDGRARRPLTTSELAQIAGRAGRYMTDGTFGTCAALGPLEPEVVEAIEAHAFKPLTAIQWRNGDLDFRSPRALLASLEARPDRAELVRAREADDQRALATLMREAAVLERCTDQGAVRLLWEICQIPDYRKTMADTHIRMLGTVFRHLSAPAGRLPADWVARRLDALDRCDGDIDTLMARIAHVRTWTYISHRPDWLDDGAAWQGRARAIEDRLSDALHERLTQRFVDRRAQILSRASDRAALAAEVAPDGRVRLDGEPLGRIEGLRFIPEALDGEPGGEFARRALAQAAGRALKGELDARVARIAVEADGAFALEDDASISWRGETVGRLRPGRAVLEPRVELAAGDALGRADADRVRARLAAWLAGSLADGLKPLFRLAEAGFAGAARGLAYQLVEALGSVPRRRVHALLAEVSRDDRRRLQRLGVRIGCEAVYLPALVKPRAARLRALLWSVFTRSPVRLPPPAGLCSVAAAGEVEASFYEACGYRVVGGRAMRIDILERLALALRRAARAGPFALTAELLAPAGMSGDEAEAVLSDLGYRRDGADGQFVAARGRHNGGGARGEAPKRPRRRPRKVDPDSPFAKLGALKAPG